MVHVDWRRGTAEQVACGGWTWESPIAVAVAPDRTRWVADAGALVRVLPGGACAAFGKGRLERPTGVAVAAGRVYAVDPPRHGVVAFAPDGSEVLRFGRRGERDGELNFPTAIADGGDGTLLVVDSLNFRVVRFTTDGQYLASFGKPGDTLGEFGRPKAVAAAGANVYVTDAQHDAVLVFSRDGRFEYVVGEGGDGPGQLLLPAGVAVDAGHLFVANAHNGRIEVYELLERSS